MIASIAFGKSSYMFDLHRPLDISIPLSNKGVNAWGIPQPEIIPHREGDFTVAVDQGAAVNFNNIRFNPHSHCTHTECLGHITEQFQSVNKSLYGYFFFAKLVTIAPEKFGEDLVISKKQLKYALKSHDCEALVIRTLPNTANKLRRDYSNTNPPYIMEEAMQYVVQLGINHLLVDLPSVDKEQDNGALRAHKTFWNLEGNPRKSATITELIYVKNGIPDGMYLLNLQTAPVENDATPSRPVLFEIISDN